MPPAIIGTREDSEQPALCKVLKAVPHALVRTQHELQMIGTAEVLHPVGAEAHDSLAAGIGPHTVDIVSLGGV